MTNVTTSDVNMRGMPLRQQLQQEWGRLVLEREPEFQHWQEISKNVLVRNGRYFVQDRAQSRRYYNTIYDNTGTRDHRIASAGIMAGASSPARQWFRLQTPDPDLNRFYSVRVWLDDVVRRMMSVFASSNTYRALQQVYEEVVGFGTAASILLPDYDNVIHHYPLTAGEYCLAGDMQGRVNTMFREFTRTVAEVVEEFGMDNVSTTVKHNYERKNFQNAVRLIHAVEPRARRDETKVDKFNMPFMSVYFEADGHHDKLLRVSGFNQFPVLAPRWAVRPGDVYGYSPAMEALGDIKQLQHEQLRKAQAIDFQTNPPVQAPYNLKNRDRDLLPGGVSFVDPSSNPGIRTAFEVNLDINALLLDIQDVRERIHASFFADLFLMLATTDKRMTATEVAERHEEKLLMLGPVLERLHNELLEPLINMTFDRMMMAGVLPPPPPELEGLELNIEFVSMLAQAQRAIGINSVDRWFIGMTTAAEVDQEIVDNFDGDAYARETADMLGVPAALLRDQKLVDARRDARAQQAQAQARMDAMQQAGAAAKDLAAAKTNEPSALNASLEQFSGLYGQTSPIDG